MTFKKLATLAMATVVSASLLVGCSGSKESAKDDKITVAMITDVAGVNDQSFNQSAWEGLQRAEKELGIEVKNFVLVDEEIDASNVKNILFKAEESAYLAGLIAGKTTKTNNVGFIGGMELPVIDTFKYGYMAGVKAANPDAKVQAQYANSFTDQAKGKAIANQMYSNGADIVFTCGGDVGTGAIEAAKENGKFAIGVDRDQSDLAPEHVLTSAIKRVDAGVFETVKSYVNGTFEGGTTTTYGLEENAVGVPDTTKNLVSQDILDLVEETITKLKNKEITVPKNKEEYNAMVK